MTSITSLAPCTRRGTRLFSFRGMMALAAALAITPTSLLAEAQVQGGPEAVRIETQNSFLLATYDDRKSLEPLRDTQWAKDCWGSLWSASMRADRTLK